jgi:hypothetical protein
MSPVELIDTTYSDLRGFNYVPSYAATIWDVIDDFDPTVWDREFGYSKRFEANALRIWCDFLSFQRDERHFLSAWEQALEIAVHHELRLMITMANRWVDPRWPYGQIDYAQVLTRRPSDEYRRYVTTFVRAFHDHLGVLMWDLCNEPFIPPLSEEEFALIWAATMSSQQAPKCSPSR